MPVLDHLLWGCPDLEAGMAVMEGLTGVKPAIGGSHPGYGTRNALMSLGRNVYLEILGPDPAQRGVSSPRLDQVKGLSKPGLISFALRGSDLATVQARAKAAGLEPGTINARSRTTPEGGVVRWRGIAITGHELGAAFPFCIDWMDTPHPSTQTPQGAQLLALSVSHPAAERLNDLYAACGFDLPRVIPGAFALNARLATPKGIVELT